MSKEETNTSNQGNAGSGSSRKETKVTVNIKPLELVPHRRGFFEIPKILRRPAK